MAKTNKPKLDIGDSFDQFTSEPKKDGKEAAKAKPPKEPKAKTSKAETKESPIVAFRLPESMKRDLDNFAANTGYSKTEIVLAGLQKVFDANPEHLKEPKKKPEIK
jgi:hypothetical protein